MAKIWLAPGIAEDFERILSHLVERGVADAADRVADIAAAIDVLRRNPMIGRKAGGSRELIIGKGSRAYVALYDWHAERDTIEVMAIRAQKEAGYSR